MHVSEFLEPTVAFFSKEYRILIDLLKKINHADV